MRYLIVLSLALSGCGLIQFEPDHTERVLSRLNKQERQLNAIIEALYIDRDAYCETTHKLGGQEGR